MEHIKFLLLSILILSINLSARIIHVPAEQPTIQAGIDESIDGDTVLVSPDIYFENINFNGKNIVVASLFLLSRDTTYISQTIIDGNQNGSVVTFANGENSNARLIGFSVQNGSGTLIGNGYSGGGIYCQNASPSIRYNIISNNSADATSLTPPSHGEGGGIYAITGSPIIEKNVINNNTAFGLNYSVLWGLGGGIYVESTSTCLIDSNQISENSNGGDGSGIYCEGDTVIISNNLVLNNDGGSLGGIACYNLAYSLIISNIVQLNPNGGIFITDCPSSYIINNLISENTFGAGIWCSNSTSKIINNTIVKNEYFIHSWGGGIKFDNSFAEVTNNIIAYNENKGIYIKDTSCIITASYNDFWSHPDGHTNRIPVGDTTWGFNYNGIPCDSFYNIYRNPLFANFPTDLHLTPASQCINSGNPDTSGLHLSQFDLDGNPRVYGSRIDAGAYEYISPTALYEDNGTHLTKTFQLYQNYPNPFNPTTRVQYLIGMKQHVLLSVYDLLGKKIAALINEEKPPGVYTVEFNASELSGGIYFYQLKAGDFTETKKMILMR